MDFAAILKDLVDGKDLSFDTACLAGDADPVQVGALLALLAAKGVRAAELAGFAAAMRARMCPCPADGPVVDIVGTGGDGHNTLNFSTAASILAASCGARVAKHGNVSVSSMSGSANVLESLGIRMLDADKVVECLNQCNIAFMFAPRFHPAMRHVVPVRKALKIRTIFNLLGPLLNPASAAHLFIGVYHPSLLPMYADAIFRLGVDKALVVHCGGLDELAPIDVAEAMEITRDGVRRLEIDPFALGFDRGTFYLGDVGSCSIEDLAGGDPAHNAQRLRAIFAGGDAAKSPAGQTVALNAGAALYVAGTCDSIEEGVRLARTALEEGRAGATLEHWSRVTATLASET